MRRALLVGVLIVGVMVPAPAQAAETCKGLPVTIFGTESDDTIVGTSGDDVILAGGGNDTVFGLLGNDTACLGQGDDRFFGALGNDTFVAEASPDGKDLFHGGPDGDVAFYNARSTPVVITMDGIADDGAASEGDNVNNTVDFLFGGSADDTLTGNVLNNRIFGGAGNDTLRGLDGDDDLQGMEGDDLLVGGLGNDSLSGGVDDDRLSGQNGDDTALGGGGDDTYLAAVNRDGRDEFTGGPGEDTADYGARNNLAPGTILSLSLDGVANDGEPGESDQIRIDVENLTGGIGRNVITGSVLNNVLVGGQSADLIFGADGIPGNDRMDGQLGTDVCTADTNDVVARCEG